MSFSRSAIAVNLQPKAGYTLLEITVVILILGITALVAIPNFSSTDPHKLELAAEEFADAMRFARSEAMRLGKPIGFRQITSGKRIRIFSVDTGTSPWTLTYDVYHPVSKQLYDIDLDDHLFAAADDLNRTRLFRGTCNTPRNIYFDSQGAPWCADPDNISVEQITTTFLLGGHTRVVTLQGITGQVSVQ